MIGFNRTLIVLTIFCMSWQTSLLAQDADLNDIHTRRYLEDIAYQQRVDQIEAFIYRKKLSGMDGENISGRGVLTIPVVVHIMHKPSDTVPNNSSSNITDDRVVQAIADLNELFSNSSTFGGSPQYTDAGISSVDTEIQFCLAEFDPQGNPSTGITRTATDLSDLKRDDACPGQIINQDECLKSLSFWNSNDYLNLWVVNSICTSASGLNAECGLTGYSYSAAAHGQTYDGPVLISSVIGGASEDAAYVAHEVGHYLNLLDTYYDPPGPKPPCTNNNCLLDGDKICDTPPDSDPAAASCFANERVNSCSTDLDDQSANNPFSTDVQDMYENYMDNADAGCRNTFTAGQKDRMRITLLGVRSSLLSSNGCDLSITNAALVAVENPGDISCEANLSPRVRVANTGSNVIGSILFRAFLNNNNIGSYTWTGNLPAGDTLGITLNPSSPIAGRNDLRIVIDEVNGSADQDERDNFWIMNFINANHGPLIQQFPYCVDFEDPIIIEDWLPGDLDGIIGFDSFDGSVCTNAGNNSLRYNTNGLWNNGSGPVASAGGTRDFFIGPQFDLTGYESAYLEFDVAFKEYRIEKALSLRVWAIDDCGNAYNLMYEKNQQALQTSNSPYDPFILAWEPASCADWRRENISLDAFTGKVIRIVFDVVLESDFSQNFYLDNICLDAIKTQRFCTLPENIPDTPGNYVATDICTDAEGWVHFIKNAAAQPQTTENLLLLSIKNPEALGVELIPEQVRVSIAPEHGSSAYDMSDADYAENMHGWFVGSRYFHIDTKHVPSSPLEIRSYYSGKDFEDLNLSLDSERKMEDDRRLSIFTIGPTANGNPEEGHASVNNDVFRAYRKGTEASAETWKWVDHGRYRSASFLVEELGFGGIGSGGEGLGYGPGYPVAFKSFYFTQNLGSVELKWTLSKEINTKLVEIYRADVNGNEEKLQEFQAAGDSDTETSYNYTDIPNTDEPVRYYVKVVHNDELEIFSETITAGLNRGDFVKVYPNPSNGKFRLDVVAEENDKIEFIVLNASWQRLYHLAWPFNGSNPEIDISHLPPGVYFYDVLIREERYMGKIVLMPGK